MRGRAVVDDPAEHVLAVAAELFYEHGVRAVGIDRVQRASGVARSTIYRHFPSKDALVVSFIEQRDEQWRSWLAQRVRALAPNPADRPLSVFRAIEERIATSGFRGCAFANTIAEFPDLSHPAHVAARRHKELVVDYLGELCRDAGFAEPSTLARQLMVLIDGAVVGAAREGGPAPGAAAMSAARALLVHAPRQSHDQEATMFQDRSARRAPDRALRDDAEHPPAPGVMG
jgi:AcrR family transcriptional regulator